MADNTADESAEAPDHQGGGEAAPAVPVTRRASNGPDAKADQRASPCVGAIF
jgi:hypothetical protein